MAISNNLLLKSVSGTIGGQIVVRQYSYGTVISKPPDMSRIKRSASQKKNQDLFKEAHYYAQSINNDPVKKAAFKKQFKLKKGDTVYRAAMREFRNKHK